MPHRYARDISQNDYDEYKVTTEVCAVICNQVGGDAVLLAVPQSHHITNHGAAAGNYPVPLQEMVSPVALSHYALIAAFSSA